MGDPREDDIVVQPEHLFAVMESGILMNDLSPSISLQGSGYLVMCMVTCKRYPAGVVGQTPTLQRGRCFEYFSAAHLPHKTNFTMEGSFQMMRLSPNNEEIGLFDALVSPFQLKMRT